MTHVALSDAYRSSRSGLHPERPVGQVTPVRSQETQKALVIAVRHVEETDDEAVVSARSFEAFSKNRFQFVTAQVAAHERAVYRRPERLAGLQHPPEQIAHLRGAVCARCRRSGWRGGGHSAGPEIGRNVV